MPFRLLPLLLVIILFPTWFHSFGQAAEVKVCAACVRADMEFLAADELHGRGSATRDEHIAALFAAAEFEELGLEPGGDNETFLQKARLPNPLPGRVADRLKNFEATPRTETWNAVAILRGTDAASTGTPPENRAHVPGRQTLGEAILLTAHLDHLGIGPAVHGDTIYNGADDDASGTTAVLTLARALAAGKRPRRTIVFALFGSEEIGGFGNQYFLEHSPVPLDHLVANLEFEMIGRPDPAVPAGDAWLTGFDRSNLGPELARHGAHLAADPHPAQQFFTRSDNYALAKRGVIAHTVSSFNLHGDYHQPSDELSRIDFPYMTRVIEGMVGPIEWLANSGFKPAWRPGGRP
jgi:hypothetical protein